jgi:hypothetical protein
MSNPRRTISLLSRDIQHSPKLSLTWSRREYSKRIAFRSPSLTMGERVEVMKEWEQGVDTAFVANTSSSIRLAHSVQISSSTPSLDAPEFPRHKPIGRLAIGGGIGSIHLPNASRLISLYGMHKRGLMEQGGQKGPAWIPPKTRSRTMVANLS